MSEKIKKELTIEELEAELKELTERKNSLHEMIEIKKIEEEKKRKAKLNAEEEDRKKEIEIALNIANDLIKKYIEDYKKINITVDDLAYLSYIFGNKHESFFNYFWN